MKHTVNRVKLDNGAEGLFIDVPGATVMAYEFNFRAGEYLVDRKKWETPHLMEHVLMGANEIIPKARAFQAEFEKNGAYRNGWTSIYHVSYESECADFEWQRILELSLLAIAKPLFLREEFLAEYGNVKDELTSRLNSHSRYLGAVTRETYGLVAMTDRERLKHIKNIRLKDLKEHYQRTHTSSNMRFIIAGSLKGRRETIRQLVENIQLPKGDSRLVLPPELPCSLNSEPVFVYRPSVKNMYFYLDTFALERFDVSHWDALLMVNSMLTATLYSRILGEARERGLVYSMGSNLEVTREASSWWFGGQVLPKNAPALFEIIVRELQRVKAGDISDEDIESAKQYLLGVHQRSAQTVGGIASGYAYRYYFDDIIDDYEAVPDRIRTVTRARIVEATQRMFSDRIGGLGVLGKKDPKLLEALNRQIQPLWHS